MNKVLARENVLLAIELLLKSNGYSFAMADPTRFLCGESDLDIIVKANVSEFSSIGGLIASKTGLIHVTEKRYSAYSTSHFYFDQNDKQFYAIDLSVGLVNGFWVPFLSGEVLVASCDTTARMRQDVYFAYKLIKSIFKNDNLGLKKIKENFFDDTVLSTFNSILLSELSFFESTILGRPNAQSLGDCIDYANRFVLFRKISSFISINNIFLNFLRLLRKVYSQPGLEVFVMGVDGAGKSTLIKRLESFFSNFYYIRRYHYRSFRLRFWVGAYDPALTHVHAPRGKKSRNNLQNFLRFVEVIFEFMLDRFVNVFLKSKHLIILTDRSVYDIVIDWERYRFTPFWARAFSFLFSVMPKPDLIVYLDIRPEEIFKRKQEYGVDVIKELSFRYKNFLFNSNHRYLCIRDNSEYENAMLVFRGVLKDMNDAKC